MRAARPVHALVAAIAALAGAVMPGWACNGSAPVALCGEIPAGGCPLGRGGSCDDTACAGLYDCVEGTWTLAVICSLDGGPTDGGGAGSDGGVDVPSGDEGSDDGGDGAAPDGACSPVVVSHGGEVSGCTPDLEIPDCLASTAEASCRESACQASCLDFFLCTKDGWTLAAYCDGQGQLVISP